MYEKAVPSVSRDIRKEFQTRDLLIHEIESMQVPYKMLKGTELLLLLGAENQENINVIRADIDGLGVLEEERNLKQKKEYMCPA